MNQQYADRLPSSWEQFPRFFAALGDPFRQRILLLFEPGEEICVNDIARMFELSRPAISHHLKVLREARLLLSEKRGKEIYYRVNDIYCASVLRDMHQFSAHRLAASMGRRRRPAPAERNSRAAAAGG